jgi:dTDP-4-dehydrorhamnose 3,5-epimerase
VIINTTPLAGVFVVQTAAKRDARGSFERLFCDKELEPVIQHRSIRQINYSVNIQSGATRGLHYQNVPDAEMKLVRCLKGRVWDVALDLRFGSATFLQWFAHELTPGGSDMMVIPEGVAHGFQTLESDSHLLYLHTAYYSPSSESAVAWNDPRLAITWPSEPSEISDRDRQHPFLPVDYKGVVL